MFVEAGWRRPAEPPPQSPRLTKRQEHVLVWVLAVNTLLWFMAPICGATLLQGLMAILRHG